jgi:hypothetical protein
MLIAQARKLRRILFGFNSGVINGTVEGVQLALTSEIASLSTELVIYRLFDRPSEKAKATLSVSIAHYN